MIKSKETQFDQNHWAARNIFIRNHFNCLLLEICFNFNLSCKFLLKIFVRLSFCQTHNWSGRPWRFSCPTPLTVYRGVGLDLDQRCSNDGS